ncbi:hypothetical protein HDU84_009830, partial [Entophlyctis sp. JEL0112]
AARLNKSDLYIRVRIGSEHAGDLALRLAAPTLAALAEASLATAIIHAAQKKDRSLLLPFVVSFNGAELSDDDALEYFIPKVDMNLNENRQHALVLVSAVSPVHPPIPLGLIVSPAASGQSQTSEVRLAGPAPARENADAPHQVMLSYNWGVKTAAGKYDMQELVKCIAAELKSVNLSVWMDIERGIDSVPLMNGDILDKMADAVNRCQVFVAVVTPEYQDSPNCNHEFKYAVTLKKRIVPVYAVDSTKLHAGAIHMVTSPLIQARFGDIFAKCQVSQDFASHSEWNNQISVLKAEIFAIINPTATSVAGTTVAASSTIVSDSSADYYSKRELEGWLKPVSFQADMNAYASQYVPGTREWAVEAIGTQFAGDANVVWLNGAAGVGKSLVAYLAAKSPPSGFTLLSAFFCKHYDEKKNNAKQL